eukprot:6176450-Pleurochrysis_carterae.AAC.1
MSMLMYTQQLKSCAPLYESAPSSNRCWPKAPIECWDQHLMSWSRIEAERASDFIYSGYIGQISLESVLIYWLHQDSRMGEKCSKFRVVPTRSGKVLTASGSRMHLFRRQQHRPLSLCGKRGAIAAAAGGRETPATLVLHDQAAARPFYAGNGPS